MHSQYFSIFICSLICSICQISGEIFCQGCACEGAFKTTNSDGVDVCYTMNDKFRKSSTECAQECALHGGGMPSVGDSCSALRLAVYVQQRLPILTIGKGYKPAHAVFLWTDAHNSTGSWQWGDGMTVMPDLWANDFPTTSGNGDHAGLAAQLGANFHVGSDVNIGELIYPDEEGNLVVAYNAVGAVAVKQNTAFCVCQARLPACSLADLSLTATNATGYIRLPGTVTQLSHGTVPIDAFELDNVHVGTVVAMHCADSHYVDGAAPTVEYDVECVASHVLGDASAWSPSPVRCQASETTTIPTITTTTVPPEPGCAQIMAVSTIEMTWTDANAGCAAIGGTLATIYSIERQIALQGPAVTAPVWVGLVKNTPETNWHWQNPNATTAYRNWAVDEPSSTLHSAAIVQPGRNPGVPDSEPRHWMSVDRTNNSVTAAAFCDVNCSFAV